MSGPPDNAMMARIRFEAEAKVRAELSLAALPLLPPPPKLVHGAARGSSGLPGVSGTVPATSSTSIGRRPPGCLGASPVNPGEPQRGIATPSSQSTSDPEVTLVGGADEKESASRKAPTRWSVDKKRILMLQVVADKPFLAKYTKGVKLLAAWDELAATISTVPDFAHAEGVTGRGCRVKYKEMMAAHRQEVKNGEFTSGVREGMDDATHEALNTCMQQEDEAEENAAKSKGEIAAIEEAKQDRAEKVHAYATKSSGSGARRKRRVSGSGLTSSGNPFSDEDEDSTPPKRRSAPATVQLEDSVASYFANQVESDETKERKLAIAESAARIAENESKAMLKMLSAQTDDPDEKAKRLLVADKEADAKVNESKARIVEAKARADEAKAKTERKAEEARLRAEETKAKIARKAEEAKARAAESESQKQFMLQMAAMMGKLAEKL